jgi:hypothetical protein
MSKNNELLVMALQALPLDEFDRDPSTIDAAEFVDNSRKFIDSMNLARVALHEEGKCSSKCQLCKQAEVDVADMMKEV